MINLLFSLAKSDIYKYYFFNILEFIIMSIKKDANYNVVSAIVGNFANLNSNNLNVPNITVDNELTLPVIPTIFGFPIQPKGSIVQDSGTNVLYISNGVTWDPINTGITSINGDSNITQFITIGSTGSSPNILNSVPGTTQVNIPRASLTNSGIVSTGIQSFAGPKTFSSSITATNGDITATNGSLYTANASILGNGSITGVNIVGQTIFGTVSVTGNDIVSLNSITGTNIFGNNRLTSYWSCKMTNSAISQVIASGNTTFNNIIYNAVSYNSGNNMIVDLTNDAITIPSDGIYLILLQGFMEAIVVTNTILTRFTIHSTAGSAPYIADATNAIGANSLRLTSSIINEHQFGCTTTRFCSAGDKIFSAATIGTGGLGILSDSLLPFTECTLAVHFLGL